MINWDEFEHIHVINKLKHILNLWWSVDTIFTDEDGNIKNTNQKPQVFSNQGVQHFLSKELVAQDLSKLVSNHLNNLSADKETTLVTEWEMTGLEVAVFPIIMDGSLLGSVVALGFLEKNSSGNLDKIKKELQSLKCPKNIIEDSISKIKCLAPPEKEHLLELVQLVAQEVVTFHLEITRRENRIEELNKELGSRYKYENMVGKSKPMQNLYALLDKIKGADSTILIQGENGTGKELIAKAIHYNSHRTKKPFVIQNCSAFNDNLLESELFGHMKGSFTGANRDKKGLFEIADQGTFFLDEIGDTSPQMQVKLLRVLQEGTFTPVGSVTPKQVDVRVVAATNKNLREMVDNGTFREDLYYRLNVINLNVPSLRERKEDIPLLVDFFLSQNSGSSISMTRIALEKLYDYSWPGNIRELQNEIERLCVLAGENTKLTEDMLSPKILQASSKNKLQGTRLDGKLKDAIENLEKNMISEGLRRTGWNKSRLAKELGISRAGLIMKVEKFGLDKRRIAK